MAGSGMDKLDIGFPIATLADPSCRRQSDVLYMYAYKLCERAHVSLKAMPSTNISHSNIRRGAK
jgi:hypothetical protein